MNSLSVHGFGRVASFVSASFLLAAVAAGQRPSFGVSESNVVRLDYGPYAKPMKGSSGETEGDMNCFEVVFARTGLRAIVQNFPDTGPEFTTNQRVLAKALTRDVVLRHGNVLNDYYESGVLYGIEFDWFFPGPMGMTRPNLPGTVNVVMENSEGAETHFASVFGFLEQDYLAHKAGVEGMIGHAMESFLVWERDALETGLAPLEIGGTDNLVQGPVTSCGDVSLLGSRNAVRGPLCLAGDLYCREGNQVEFVETVPMSPDAIALPPLAVLRAEAQARGTYFAGDAVLSGELPANGLVFAEGDLVVAAEGAGRRWTLVSANGDVELRGDRADLRAWAVRTLALAYAGDVRILGDGAVLVGEVHAPEGRLDVVGSGNTLLGAFSGAGATLVGSANVLSDGTRTLHLR